MPFPLSANSRSQPIPDALRDALAPAQLALFEWTDYFFQWPGADALEVDGRAVEPLAPGLFRVRWENALGLASLQPLRDGAPFEAPLWVEVLSPKFPSPAQHVAFLRALLEGLCALSPQLIWSDAGATRRGFDANRIQPSPGQTLDWAWQHGAELERVLATIARHPARAWHSQTFDAPAREVANLGASHLAILVSDGARWQRTARGSRAGGAVAGEFAPARVPQVRRHQSLDVPDNRGALAFVRALGDALRAAQNTRWWPSLGADRRDLVGRLGQTLSGFEARWHAEVGAPNGAWRPRAAPYRALWQLQESFHGAGAPLWSGAQQFARTRDVASLWEFWSFFALVARIEHAWRERATIEANWNPERGLLAPSRARFGDWTLTFNGPAPSYSTPLRPDYLWSSNGRAVAAFDAKFRVEVPGQNGRGADLHKMHAYRDALGVRAAIALHPGTVTSFFDRERGPLALLPLRAILEGAAAGVGLWGVGASFAP